MNRLLLSLFAGLIGLGGGIVLCRFGAVEFDPKIDLGDLVQAVTVIAIFLIANQVYQRLHDDRRKRVEILIDVAGDALTEVDKVHTASEECGDDGDISRECRLVLDSALTRYSNAVYTLEEALKQYSVPWRTSEFENIKTDREAYKDLLTAFPYPQRFPQSMRSEEAKKYGQIRTNLRLFQLRLSQEMG